MIRRREFIGGIVGGAVTATLGIGPDSGRLVAAPASHLPKPIRGEDIVAFVHRIKGSFNDQFYKQILGAANAFKEGDEIVGVVAADNASRETARTLLANTRLREIDDHPVLKDNLFHFLKGSVDKKGSDKTADLALGELKQFLLTEEADSIQSVMGSLSSDVIGCVVKLMTNQELIAAGAKIFNPLPGSQIGAAGYLGARIQPNSPTDNVDDIRWQVLDGWSRAFIV